MEGVRAGGEGGGGGNRLSGEHIGRLIYSELAENRAEIELAGKVFQGVGGGG